MQRVRWEYMVRDRTMSRRGMVDTLDDAGLRYWELVGVDDKLMFFKRPIVETNDAAP